MSDNSEINQTVLELKDSLDLIVGTLTTLQASMERLESNQEELKSNQIELTNRMNVLEQNVTTMICSNRIRYNKIRINRKQLINPTKTTSPIYFH